MAKRSDIRSLRTAMPSLAILAASAASASSLFALRRDSPGGRPEKLIDQVIDWLTAITIEYKPCSGPEGWVVATSIHEAVGAWLGWGTRATLRELAPPTFSSSSSTIVGAFLGDTRAEPISPVDVGGKGH